MLVPFHSSVTHALAAVLAVLPATCKSHNASLSGVIYCIYIKHRQNSVVSEPTRQSKRVDCTTAAAAAAAWQ